MNPKSHINCDYLFAGTGASATLLLMRMEKAGLLAGKKVVLLDTDFTSLSRKTFCFWAKPDDNIVRDCHGLIQKTWNHLRIDRGVESVLKPLQYHYIPGENMKNAMLALAERNACEMLESAVVSMISDDSGVVVTTGAGSYLAARVFDSRPAGFMAPKPNETSLFQSFIGYMIEPEHPIANTDSMDMMDFGVDQQGATQFMYVLPLSERKALVELTRFGIKKITEPEAAPVLENYIQRHFGNARILETETGCIPMCSAPLEITELEGVTRLGSRAGAIKPGTGYAFKNMHRQAAEITLQLQNKQVFETKHASARFKFYDRLLLRILAVSPDWGKPIFQQLFRKNSTPQILQFLDEKTTLRQDAGILLSLPFRPFLAALKQDVRYNPPAMLKPVLLTLLSLLFWFVYAISPSVFFPLQWAFIGVGLLAVGIPHGALDHLLESGKVQGRAEPLFVAKYLAIMLLYLLLWWLQPWGALVVFLGYSAFHFGQSDIQEWQITRYPNLKSFLWGIIMLGIILFSHLEEAMAIVNGMGVAFAGINPGESLIYMLVLAVLLWALVEKNAAILLSLLMLVIGTQLPLPAAFGLYFIGQHSLNGWSHLQKGMGAAGETLFRKALPFTFGALILLGLLMMLVYTGIMPWTHQQWISVFFVFLACLSLPHVWAMHRFYNRSGK